jgi:glycosyl transferase family 2
MLPRDLVRIDAHPISEDRNEIRLFGVVRDESLRLPFFLDYYRRLGVGRFFIVDNASTDGTTEYLLAQEDCCVFSTQASYAKSRAGLTWLNPLLEEYGADRWIVLADADELLVYPHIEKVALPDFCRWLDRTGAQGMFTLLLDMYSKKPLDQIKYEKGHDFLSECQWFDRDYHFVPRLGVPILQPAFPSVEPIGGPRLRLCFPQQNVPQLWPRLRVKLKRRLGGLLVRIGLAEEGSSEPVATQAFKVPLVKWRRGYAFITSHRPNPVRLTQVTGALLHFKYFQDFTARVKDAVERQNHYDGSAEYRKYAELLRRDPGLAMCYAGSVRYNGSDKLVRLRLINSDCEWDEQCAA